MHVSCKDDAEQQLENFIEPIYEDLDGVQVWEQRGSRALSEADDSQGIQRVLEILECNTWTGMTSKKAEEPK